MAFIIDAGGNVVSFAEYTDVTTIDQRVFEANEGLTQDIVEDMLERSTQRLLQKVKASDWWREYAGTIAGGFSSLAALPTPNANLFQRRADWTEVCVFHTLYAYLYPKIANFSDAESAEVQKIVFYENRMQDLFMEMISMGDFYDRDGDGTVENDEKLVKYALTRRTRGRKSIVRVK
jgi:hypothetical protein|tara:strand:+ start:32 stop:562 length:531 start_codon:yes stop_codon:yes gene_type:complete